MSLFQSIFEGDNRNKLNEIERKVNNNISNISSIIEELRKEQSRLNQIVEKQKSLIENQNKVITNQNSVIKTLEDTINEVKTVSDKANVAFKKAETAYNKGNEAFKNASVAYKKAIQAIQKAEDLFKTNWNKLVDVVTSFNHNLRVLQVNMERFAKVTSDKYFNIKNEVDLANNDIKVAKNNWYNPLGVAQRSIWAVGHISKALDYIKLLLHYYKSFFESINNNSTKLPSLSKIK